jgi:hypothetical protein
MKKLLALALLYSGAALAQIQPYPNLNYVITAPVSGQCFTYNGTNWVNGTCPGGSPAFNAVAPGTNTGALLVGTGGTLAPTGTGTIAATSLTVLSGLPSGALPSGVTSTGGSTLVGTTDTQTLTNKTLTAANLGQPSTIDLTNTVAGTLPLTGIANIATGNVLGYFGAGSGAPVATNALIITTGNALGLLYFPTTTTLASSAALTNGALIVGSASGPVSFGGLVNPNSSATNTSFGAGCGVGGAGITGTSESCFGQNSLNTVTTGSSNSCFGQDCGVNITTGGGNSGLGATALQGTGVTPITGSNNTANGYESLFNCQGACGSNTAIGAFAGDALTTGLLNVFIGYSVGFGASATTTGQSNVLIGTSANLIPTATTTNNEVDIGTSSTYLLRITGGGTPTTSAATFAGTLNATGGTSSFGTLTTLSIPAGVATFAVGTNVTSVVCATSYSCNNSRGTLTIVGGTATTGTIATVSFSAALSAAPACFAWMNAGATAFGVGNGVPSTTSFTITAAVSVAAATFNVNYECRP